MVEEKIIYQKGNIKVTVVEHINTGRKTRSFGIWRESPDVADPLGTITYDTRWRQYTFNPENDTKWSAGCLQSITSIIMSLNFDRQVKMNGVIK